MRRWLLGLLAVYVTLTGTLPGQTCRPNLTDANHGVGIVDSRFAPYLIEGLASISNLAINVKDCGAKGDGVADDWAAIQAAINLAGTLSAPALASGPATAGIVYFPPGTFRFTQPLVLKSLVWLAGYHRFTILAPAVGAGVDAIKISNGTKRIVLAGMAIDCAASGVSGASCRDAITVDTSDDVRFRAVWEKSATRNGLYVANTPVMCIDCSFELNTGAGVWVTQTNSGNPFHMVGCYIYANHLDGITFDLNANEGIVEGCEIVSNAGSGISFNNSSKLNKIVGNTFTADSTYGVYVNSTGTNFGNIVTGNTFSQISQNAIFVNAQDQTIIDGNVIVDASNGNNGTYAAIRLNTSNRASITNNQIRSTTGANTTYGIQEAGSSTMTIVANNAIYNMLTAPWSFTTDPLPKFNGNIGQVGGTSSALDGVIHRASGLTTTSTSDVSISPKSLLGGTLGINGQAVRLTMRGSAVTQAAVANIKFGATTISTGAVTAGNTFEIDCIVTRTGAAAQVSVCLLDNGTVIGVNTRTTPTETLANNITIDFRGSVTAGGTLNVDFVGVEIL